MNRLRHRWTLVAIFGLVVLFDQSTKFAAVARLTGTFEYLQKKTFREKLVAFYGANHLESDVFQKSAIRKPPYVVIKNYWNHRYVENPGGAWGMLAGIDPKWRLPFFHIASLTAFVLIGLYLRKLDSCQRWLSYALAMTLGGAVGNYIDRLTRGYVIDFIDWHWHDAAHWPTFNIADCALSLGVAIMLLDTLLASRQARAAKKASKASQI